MAFANILLVSAHPADKALVASALSAIRDQPYRLEVASTLSDALARIKHGRVDTVLLDLNLPDSAGLTTFLRAQPKATETPIIVIVSESENEVGPDAVARGALDFLVREQLSSQMIERVLRYATERTHTLLALRASEQRYRELFQNVTAGVFQTTCDGKFMAANPALVRMLGYDSEDELLELDIPRDIYMEADQRDHWVRAMKDDGEVRNAELVLKRRDGTKIVVLENSRAVRDAEGHVIFYEGTLTDITAAHELSQQLSYDATHDALTGLTNRREFEGRLQHSLELTQATGAQHAVLFMDLDRFKRVNDTCGHIAGDELLRQLSEVLQGRVRSGDIVARLGGDEFAVLLQNCSQKDALQVAQQLLAAIHKFEFLWGHHRFTLSISIGLVAVNAQFTRIAQVLNAADSACYQAKDAGRGGVVVYRDAAIPLQSRHGEMDWGLRTERALAENRLFLEAQPIVPLTCGPDGAPRLPHYELFVRMRDESGRVVPPGGFLPAVERHGLSVRYDRWVIATACRWASENPSVFDRVARLFINLTRDSVVDPELAEFVRTTLASNGVDPARIGFEAPESVVIGHLGKANLLIGALRRAGCAFALDDFGSGVSSFAYVKALGADCLKIDGMFVGNVSRDHVDHVMVRSIKDIGHAMGKVVIAKSVENEAVLAKLREIGVDYAQGYATGQPQPIETLAVTTMNDLLA